MRLPEPPSLNRMIELAKQRTRRTRDGGWMKRSLPVVYDQELERYELECLAMIREQRIRSPRAPWSLWRLTAADFRLHSLRDMVELMASLKWPVDAIVRAGFAMDDSPRELIEVCKPTQRICRSDRGVTITIEQELLAVGEVA